jgi:hypothetical protein
VSIRKIWTGINHWPTVKMSAEKTSATTDDRPEINYPLVELTRPPIYRSLKYWGKKPHNIWSQYIERYCPKGGVIADPFAGSAVAAFEAVKLGRKAIAFDLNPLSAFIIETTASKWIREKFLTSAGKIRTSVSSDAVYIKHFKRSGGTATVLNYRWEKEKIVSVGIESATGVRELRDADSEDIKLAAEMRKLPIKEWYPTCQFPSHPSVGQRFLNDIGGPTIDNLWTRRNLYILAEIFKNIAAVTDKNIKLQLLSAFVQTLHLCSKMVIPRNTAANRDFSGSWGRPDYLVRRRRMEQNPLDVFWRSCSGRAGVVGMMDDAAETFPNGIDIHDAKTSKKIRPKADINYGAIDVAQLEDYIGKGKMDFPTNGGHADVTN